MPYGSGPFLRLGFIFFLDLDDKGNRDSFSGIWIGRVMFGKGHAAWYASDMEFDFLFIGTETGDFWFTLAGDLKSAYRNELHHVNFYELLQLS